MTTLVRFVLHEPIFAGVVAFCLAIIAGLLLSDRAEKRRTRELLQAREASRQAVQGKPLRPAAPRRAVFRLFRWEFALASAVAICLIFPGLREPQKVSAKERTEADAPSPSSKLTNATTASLSGDLAVVPSNPGVASPVMGMRVPEGAAYRDSLFDFDSQAEWESLSDLTRSEVTGDFMPSQDVTLDAGIGGRFGRR